MKDRILACAKKFGADLVGFAPAERFSTDDAIFRIFPETKTVIGLAFRVLRGTYRGVEEGTNYFQYSTMGIENLEEVVMPQALLNVSNLIEEEGFEAVPQRKNQLIMSSENGTNPEVNYDKIYRGIQAENQIDFLNCAVQCGLGERSMIGSLLTPEFGPFVRYCFILTDCEIEGSELLAASLCDHCGECIKACPGSAIKSSGEVDDWRCAVYYIAANGEKNPFMPPDAYSEFEDRMEIINGTAKMDREKAMDIMDNTYFYVDIPHSYRSSICGRACDRACYCHLEEKGLLTRQFKKKFRSHEWSLSTRQYETGVREKEWEFSVVKKRFDE